MSCPSRALEKRWKVETWHPNARQLKLFHIPVEARRHVRRRIGPWLRSLPVRVRAGACRGFAQSFAITANDDCVKNVEGVWSRPSEIEQGELPGLEIGKYISEDCRVITVKQSVWRGNVQDPKTTNAFREVDVAPELAAFLRKFIGIRTAGFLFTGKRARAKASQ